MTPVTFACWCVLSAAAVFVAYGAVRAVRGPEVCRGFPGSSRSAAFDAMAALAASFARLSVTAPRGKAAAPARLAARSSTAFAAGAVALRKVQPVVKAVRLTVAPVEARHMPGKNGLKTRKSAAKRYKVTAGGKVRLQQQSDCSPVSCVVSARPERSMSCRYHC